MTFGCSETYLLTPQSKLNDFPCRVSDTGVNVRIRNKSNITFTEINLKVAGKQEKFPGLQKDEMSCYKNMPYIWTNNSMDVLFSKQKGYVQTVMLAGVDHIGENKIEHGYVTIDIAIKKSKKVIIVESHFIIDGK